VSGRKFGVVIDQNSGWRVIHPTFLSLPGVALNLLFAVPAAGAMAIAFFELVAYENVVGFLLGCCVSAMFLGGIYAFMCQYYVAFNNYHIAHGYLYRAPRELVPRPEVSRARWGPTNRTMCGQLLDSSDNVLMNMEPHFAKRRVALMARELGIPFSG